MEKIGLISGSGLDNILAIEKNSEIKVDTKYGEPSSVLKIFKVGEVEFYSLARHGDKHNISPANINYRANIDAFHQLGIEKIVAFASSGAINKNYPLGSLVLSSDAVDKTYKREQTFYDKTTVAHIDLSSPFCNLLRNSLVKTAENVHVKLITDSVAICTEGPRIETAAEIKYYKLIGADTVGMTLFPEVTLARERQICYASIAIVSNYAAGINEDKITADELALNVAKAKSDINKILLSLADTVSYKRECSCADALRGTIFND